MSPKAAAVSDSMADDDLNGNFVEPRIALQRHDEVRGRQQDESRPQHDRVSEPRERSRENPVRSRTPDRLATTRSISSPPRIDGNPLSYDDSLGRLRTSRRSSVQREPVMLGRRSSVQREPRHPVPREEQRSLTTGELNEELVRAPSQGLQQGRGLIAPSSVSLAENQQTRGKNEEEKIRRLQMELEEQRMMNQEQRSCALWYCEEQHKGFEAAAQRYREVAEGVSEVEVARARAEANLQAIHWRNKAQAFADDAGRARAISCVILPSGGTENASDRSGGCC